MFVSTVSAIASSASGSTPASESCWTRQTIGCQHELGAGALERVERVEELLLGARLALQELDVIDEQDADATVGRLERLERAGVQRAHELVGEGLGGRVEDAQPVAVLGDVVGDRVQEMRLAEPRRAADEERVVGEAGHLRDGQRSGVGQAIGVADHELVECEARVEGRACEAARRRLDDGRMVVTRDELHARVRAEYGRRAGCDETREAGLHPGAARRRRLDDERPRAQLASRQWLEPELPGGVPCRTPHLSADAPPGVWKVVVGHRSAEGPPRGEVGGSGWPRGDLRGPGAANIAKLPRPGDGSETVHRKTRGLPLSTLVDGVCTALFEPPRYPDPTAAPGRTSLHRPRVHRLGEGARS
jgi:hypothetical protein